MNDSFGGGFNATAGGGAGAASEDKAEGVLPLTIKHILLSPDDGVVCFGIQYSMIALVSLVRNIDHSSTKITYSLEDHSGQIDAHLWLEEGDTMNSPDVAINSYARIIGSVRNQGGNKTVMIFKIEQVHSPNELTTHLLEVLNARYKAEEYSKKTPGDNAASTGAGVSTGGFMETDTNHLGLSGKQLAIYKAIKAHGTDAGISRQELHRKFNHMNLQEISTITDYMTTEGHIYTSIDADHFLCVES